MTTPNPMEERLAAARARKEAAQAKIEDAAKQRGELAEVEAAEREAEETEALASAISDHGALGVKITTAQTAAGLVILKQCSGATWHKFQDTGKYDTFSVLKLLRPCIVYPNAARVDRILEEKPAALEDITNAFSALMGKRAAELSGKS